MKIDHLQKYVALQNRHRKYVKLSNFSLFLYASITIFCMFSLVWVESRPTLHFVDDISKSRSDKYQATGTYSSELNIITVDISNNPRVAHTILHEYGHYLYYQEASKTEIMEWKILCKTVPDMRLYPAKSQCYEKFAEEFADFVDFNYTSNTVTYNYMRNIYEKYIN